MNIINTLIVVFLGVYSILLVLLWFGWNKIPNSLTTNFDTTTTTISIIIPVRNEISSIKILLQCIENQSYNKELFEVIVVNDNSTDGTLELLLGLKGVLNLNLEIIDLGEFDSQISRKKLAISKAIEIAKGDLIICTDGDCIVGRLWLKSYASYYESGNYEFISGPVTFQDNTFFDNLQIVEFASLVGAGASSLQLGVPNMCNGANLAFKKAAFQNVNGYDGFESIPSGDDEFLLHKMAKIYPNGIGFIKDVNAIVKTNAQGTISDFLNQRKRWASKWNKYLNIRNSVLAIFIFGCNLLFVVSIILGLFGYIYSWVILVIGFKILIEIVFISSILSFFNYSKKIFLIPLVQIIYPFYVIFTALNTTSKSYVWKGRVY